MNRTGSEVSPVMDIGGRLSPSGNDGDNVPGGGHHTWPRTLGIALITQLALFGCGGGGGGGGSGGSSSGGGGGSTVSATFSSIQNNVFTPTCAVSGCHSGGSPAQGLSLEADNSYTLLVGVASNEEPGTPRVDPGDPDNSYLVQKLEGTASSGERMPLGGSPLSSGTIQAIRQWITDGAVDDRVESSEPIRVKTLSPAPGTELITSPSSIIAGFDRDLDATTVNSSSMILTASGGDGTFGDGNETSITASSINVPSSSSAAFDLGATELSDDTYQITLKGDGGAAILDLDSNALDGEYTSSLPSGDGVAGGDFVATFTVALLQPTLDEIQAKIFTPTCSTSGCHEGPASSDLPSGLDLSSGDDSFASLVNVDSIKEPAFKRVLPNDPDNSYLIHKLEGTNNEGNQMPRGLPPLDQDVIDVIRQWITDGAAR